MYTCSLLLYVTLILMPPVFDTGEDTLVTKSLCFFQLLLGLRRRVSLEK